MAKRCKIAVKKYSFRDKKRVIGCEKIASWEPTRKAKWCKMQVIFFKWTKKWRG